jgi:DNA-binding MarR family transcriptional regulator
MTIPAIGESYRGVDGHIGYLLRQAWRVLFGAMEVALRPHRLTPYQYGALSVLAREPGASGADLARAVKTTPQAMNGVLATLEREALIERRPHPWHGRILQATLTSEGRRRLEAANPAVRALERAIERDFSSDEIATVKTWLVATAQRLERATESRAA